MTLHCCLCGRLMNQAAVMIGNEPVGPKCAQRTGLLAVKVRPGSRVRLFSRRPRKPKPGEPVTMDLFEELTP